MDSTKGLRLYSRLKCVRKFKVLVKRYPQGSNLDSHTRKMQETFIQARKLLRVAFSRRQNVKTKLE